MIEEYGIDNSSQLTRVVYDDHIHQLTVTFVKGTKYKLVLLANFGTSKLGIKRRIYT